MQSILEKRLLAVLQVHPDSNSEWYNVLLGLSTHRLDVDPTTTMLFCDARYSSRACETIVTLPIPAIESCRKRISPTRQILPMQVGDFYILRPPQHIKVEFFIKNGKNLPPKLLVDIVRGLRLGFPTHYRGGRFRQKLYY